MCGICGELRFDSATPDLAALQAMSRQVARRGPDHAGAFADGPLGFAHRRLAIIDLSHRSHQPLVDAELGLSLVFNGTIYNYRALRAELTAAGYHFFSEGDSEVILKAYAAWGEDCVARLHGMFAFAIWDQRAQQLFLARDRFGIKPLYYAETAGHFRFASNPQALLAAGDVDTTVDPVALHYQFTLHGVVPAPHTVLRGVRKLAPASWLRIGLDGGRASADYWQLSARRPAAPMSEPAWTDAIHEALRTAVERRKTVADVPVGVLLSGGLDSSLLVALLAEAGVEDLLTFSVGFEDSPEERGSEFEYSDAVVARYATRHHKFRVPNSQVLERLPEAVACMAEPMFGQDAVAFYLLAEQVSRHVKVVQSGQGADEVFGGYFWYPPMLAGAIDDVDQFSNHYFDRDHAEYLAMVQPDLHGADHTRQWMQARFAAAPADTLLDRVLHTDVTALVVDDPVKRVDNMTMAWGLEARVPFLDHELVELAAQMPPELKIQSGGKHVLKTIARSLLPATVIDRPKGYFPVPALKYVRGPFLEFMRSVLHDDACRRRGLFQAAYIERLLADPEGHLTRIRGSKLWHLAVFEYWLQVNVDGRSTAA